MYARSVHASAKPRTGPANSWKPYARISSGQDLCNAEVRVYVRECVSLSEGNGSCVRL